MNINEVSSKVLGMLPFPKTDHPFQTAPVVGQKEGFDLEWDGPGIYFLFRIVGTDYCVWRRMDQALKDNEFASFGPDGNQVTREAVLKSFGGLQWRYSAQLPTLDSE